MNASLLNQIPAELRALPQWVGWRYETRADKQTKAPINAKSNGKLAYAKSNDPATWSDFETAVAAAERLNLEGVGLMVSADDGLTGLDLDHVFDPATGEIAPLAREVLARFAGTYAEISPSGTGIRIWCYGKPQRSGKCVGKVKWLEVYSHPSNRYLTVTGNQWPGSAAAVTEQQAALDWLHARFMGAQTSKDKPRSPSVDSSFDLDDAALLDKARNAKNGALFGALWSGDLSGYGGDHSAADLALLNLLAFWTGSDAARMDRLFRQSGLMRDKWDIVHHATGETYGQATIVKAIAFCRETYRAGGKGQGRAKQAFTEGENVDSRACKTKFNPTLSALPTFPLEIQLDIPTGLDGLSCTSYIFRLQSSLEDTDDKGNPELIESKVAKTLAECLKNQFAFCRQAGSWYAFVETHWQIMNTPVIDEVVTRLLYEGAPSGFKARTLAAILSLLTKGLLPLPAMATADCRRIPFSNGLLDPVTRTLTPITPDNALTWCLPYAYDPTADCPTIKAWLRQAVSAEDSEDSDNPDDLVEFIRAWFAALLTGRADLQVFLHLLGPGKTGKGTLIRLAEALIGWLNATVTSLRTLETNRFETAALFRKRLVAITDSGKYGGSIDVFKALTGQDPLRLERKHQQQGKTFIFDGTVLIASNEPLQFNDYTAAVERRRLTVEFSRRVTDEERAAWDVQGGETAVLHREIPGLVNWVLALSRDEVTHRIRNRPQQVSRANQEAMQHSNPVADWLIQQVVPDPAHSLVIGGCVEVTRTTATGSGDSESRRIFEQADSHAYPNYRTWCVRFSRAPVSTRQFSGLILDIARTLGAGVQKRRNSLGMYIKGLRLRTTSDGSRRFWGAHVGTMPEMQDDEGSSFQNSQAETNCYVGSAESEGKTSTNYSLYERERTSPLALRIVGTLQAAGPGGMTPDDLTRTVDAGKTGPALVNACINRLLLDGRIGRVNGRLIANPEARH